MPLPVPSRSQSRSPEKKDTGSLSVQQVPTYKDDNERIMLSGDLHDQHTKHRPTSTYAKGARPESLREQYEKHKSGLDATRLHNAERRGDVVTRHSGPSIDVDNSTESGSAEDAVNRLKLDSNHGQANSTTGSRLRRTNRSITDRAIEKQESQKQVANQRLASNPGTNLQRKPSTKSNTSTATSVDTKRISTGSVNAAKSTRSASRTSTVAPPSAMRHRDTTVTRKTSVSSNTSNSGTPGVVTRPATSTTDGMRRTPSTNVPPSTRTVPGASSATPSVTSSSRPSFSTFQQHYSPAKLPHPTKSSTAKPATSSSTSTKAKHTPRQSSFSTVSTPAPTHAKPTATSPSPSTTPIATDSSKNYHENLRHQTHLLHHSLLHEPAARTHAYLLKTAHARLLSRHNSLRTLHHDVLALERSARQHRNILALHHWAAGNVVSLSRRLGALVSVLGALGTLVGVSLESVVDGNHGSINAPTTASNDRQGDYAKLVTQFAQWVAWARDVWALRDAATAAESSDSNSINRSGHGTGENHSEDAATREEALSFAIEPLGDAFKASLRVRTNEVGTLVAKMEELMAVPVPGVEQPRVSGGAEPELDGAVDGEVSVRVVESTAGQLVKLANDLVQGMAEELQLMREVEFEVLEGEKTWIEERMRKAREEVEGGFGTPGRW